MKIRIYIYIYIYIYISKSYGGRDERSVHKLGEERTTFGIFVGKPDD
jgi:hypothetical protein